MHLEWDLYSLTWCINLYMIELKPIPVPICHHLILCLPFSQLHQSFIFWNSPSTFLIRAFVVNFPPTQKVLPYNLYMTGSYSCFNTQLKVSSLEKQFLYSLILRNWPVHTLRILLCNILLSKIYCFLSLTNKTNNVINTFHYPLL